MSERRIPDRIIIVRLPRKHGKVQHKKCKQQKVKVEVFSAYQFRKNHRRADGNFSPRVPIQPRIKKIWYNSMFRLRINGKWFSPGGGKYEFFNTIEVAEIVAGNISPQLGVSLSSIKS